MMSEYVGKLDSLPAGLRESATYLVSVDDDVARAKHLMRLAADRLEHFEALERERLEHEAVAPEQDTTRASHAEKARHVRELRARGWWYDEARKGFRKTDEATTELPLIPMRDLHDGDEAYTAAMVAWVRTVTDTEAKR
jgi:hypothetical protein